MSKISSFTFSILGDLADGSTKEYELPVLAYFTDTPLPIREDPKGPYKPDDFISYMQGLFNDDLWYSLIPYFKPSSKLDAKWDFIKKIFPNAVQLPSDVVFSTHYPFKNDFVFENMKMVSDIGGTRMFYNATLGTGYITPIYNVETYTYSNYVNIRIIIFPESYIDGDVLTLPPPDGGQGTIKGVEMSINIRNNGDCTVAFDNSQVFFGGILPIYDYFNGYKPPILSTDPYDPGGVSGPGGGGGSFTDDNVPVGIPSLPAFSASDSGFLTLWNPNKSQLQNLASYMWSDNFDINGWKKLFADPMDAILGLSLVPVAVPDGGMTTLKVGNIDTGVNMTRAGSQWVTLDCGSVTLNKYWGAYLDQEPHTKLDLYLPFIGVHPISADEVMSKTVHVAYHVDILSGACMAYVEVDGSVLYSFSGHCATQLPVTSADFSNQIMGALQIAGQIGTMVATGGMTAPMSIPGLASTAINMVKPSIERSGSLSGNAGFMGMKTPYFIITRPRQAVPERQNEFLGYPTFITKLLGEVTGYTEIENIHLENVPCTDSELSEIEQLLKSGVIF